MKPFRNENRRIMKNNSVLRKGYVICITCMAFLSAAALPSYGAEEIIVSAAASLTNVMEEISRSFEKQTPGVTVRCNFGASGSLVQQMINGAPVDVFASASIEDMKKAEAKNLIKSGTTKIFATNQLVLIVPAGSDVPVGGISDLRKPAFKKIAVGHPETVPAGRYAKKFLTKNGLWEALYDRLVYANSVREVLDYVRRGETDAGFVYATDAAMAGDKIRVKAKPTAGSSLNILYPIAVTRMSRHPETAAKFCEFVSGPEGQKILSAHGFGKPE
ncbi:MAG: molybdate ABC transporter substrate-binding protein [Desulfosalsimonadaceae bacterium]